MHKLVKPNGQEVEVNDNSLEHALSLGWKKKAAKKAAEKKPSPKSSKAK